MRGLSVLPLLLAVPLVNCGSPDQDTPSPAPRLVPIDAAPARPSACSEFLATTGAARSFEAGPRRWELRGDELIASPGDDILVIGVVADGHGAHADTLANLASARAEFRKAGVELVLALGGMGKLRQELTAALGAVADPGWPLLAMPGDREAIDELRAATEALGDTVIDGSQARLVRAEGAVIGLLPGAFDARHLPAGPAGCLSTASDAEQLAARLGAIESPRAVASYVPPRQRGTSASDRTRDGIHVGRRDLATALATVKLSLVLSAMVEDPTFGPITGNASAGRRSHLAAGSIDAAETASVRSPAGYPGKRLGPSPRGGTALIVQLSAKRLDWRRLRFSAGTLRSP